MNDYLNNVQKGTLKGCIDDYFCTSPRTAVIRQALLGPLSLVLLLFSLTLNIFIISILGHRRLRSAANAYIGTAIVSDTLHCVIYLIGIVMPSITSNHQHQILVYETIVAYLVPLGEPLGHMLSLLTGLCLISAVIIRIQSHLKHQNYHQSLNGNQSEGKFIQNIKQNTVTRRLHLMTTITVVLLITAPTFLRYKVLESEFRGKVSVRVFYTALLWQTGWNIYDTVLLAISACLLVILILVLYIITKKWKIRYVPSMRSLKRLNMSRLKLKRLAYSGVDLDQANHQAFPDQREAVIVLKRIRMEIRLVTILGILWALGAIGYCMMKLFKSLGDFHLKSNVIQERFLVLKLIIEFSQILLLFMRTISFLIGGVLIRRVLCNMLCLWLNPSRYKNLHERGDQVLLDRILPFKEHDNS